MSETISASTVGNPIDGHDSDPWSAGHPVAGERVAIFAYDVTSVDGQPENLRSFHVAPADLAKEGPIGAPSGGAQGISGHWTGCGTGTVVGPADREAGEFKCEVAPDDPRLA